MSQRLYCLLCLSNCCPNVWEFFCPESLCQGSGHWKLWAQVRFLADFLAGYEVDSLARFFPLLFLPILKLLSPSMPLLTKYWAGHHLSISKSCAWNCSLKIGIQTHVAGTPCYVFSLSHIQLGLDSAKTHGAWFQDLMKLRFLMSHWKKFSERHSDR